GEAQGRARACAAWGYSQPHRGDRSGDGRRVASARAARRSRRHDTHTGRPARGGAAGNALARCRGRGSAGRPGGRLSAALPDDRAESRRAERRPRAPHVRLRRAGALRYRCARSGRRDRPSDGGRGTGVRAGRRGRRRHSRPRRSRRGITFLVMGITFLSDFGLQDDFVGTCHGVIATIAPDARVIDVTHGVRPGHVLQGALVLANTVPYMPSGVHLAVVDPGVGSSRRPLALRDREGRLYVGPDNGLLLPAAERFGGVTEAHELASAEYSVQPVSRTFHGRDLFAPAAAHLAAGVALEELGPPVDPDELVRVDLPKPEVGQNRIRTVAL